MAFWLELQHSPFPVSPACWRDLRFFHFASLQNHENQFLKMHLSFYIYTHPVDLFFLENLDELQDASSSSFRWVGWVMSQSIFAWYSSVGHAQMDMKDLHELSQGCWQALRADEAPFLYSLFSTSTSITWATLFSV